MSKVDKVDKWYIIIAILLVSFIVVAVLIKF
jgi:hypothetical protein